MKRDRGTSIKRITALMIAVFMTVGQCMPALAAGLTDAYPASDGPLIQEDVLQEDNILSDESGEVSEDVLITDNSAETGISGPLMEDDSDVGSDKTPDVVLNDIMSGEGLTADTALPVSGSDYEITRYPSRITVKNKAAVKDNEHDLYAVVFYADKNRQSMEVQIATRIEAGSTVSMYRMFDENGEDKALAVTDDYVVLLGRAYEWVDELGNNNVEDFGLIGWMPEFDEEGEPKKDTGGNILYTEYNVLDRVILPAGDTKKDTEPDWKDGYTGINMKALIQKNMQIKISWAPNSKDDLQKTFKKYALFELTPDETAETGYKETLRWPLDKFGAPAAHSSSKSAVLSPGINKDSMLLNSSLIYMLKCYDKDDKEAGRYLTTAAPYLFRMQSGFEVTMTQSRDTTSMSYLLEMAARNKESDGVKVTDGFRDDWAVEYTCDNLDAFYSIGEYPVDNKTVIKAVQLLYAEKEPEAVIGKPGFARARSVAYIDGKRVVSAPSNVLSCKAGPEKCYVLWEEGIAGIIYDPKDAKSNSNQENRKRVNAHADRIIKGEDTSGLERDQIYIHGNDTGTCIKNGTVFFFGAADESGIKSYDLLRSDKLNGTYKKVKSYPLNSPELIKCNASFEGRPVYAMHFNSFPPEKDFYYAVCAVSKTGSAQGARGEGALNRTTPDKVQGIVIGEADQTQIVLAWDPDECVKQYWIYRGRESFGSKEEATGMPIAKVSGKKSVYYDKKVETDVRYFYYVRPVYDAKKAAADPKYNMDLSSDEVQGKATAKYAVIKNFYASNYSMNRIQLSYSQAKGITEYRLWRLEVSSSEKMLTDAMKPDIYSEKKESESWDEFENRIDGWTIEDWKNFCAKYRSSKGSWQLAGVNHGSGTTTAKQTFEDNVQVGHYYFYLVQGATGMSSGFIFTPSKQIRNVPLGVTELSAGYCGYGSGIRLSWGTNSRDAAYKSDLTTVMSLNGGKTWVPVNPGYIDFTLPRGQERTYLLAVVYHFGQPDYVASSISMTACSLPERIETNIKDDKCEIYVGDTVEIKARAVADNGQTAIVNHISFEKSSDVLDGEKGKYTGAKPGEATVVLKCAGLEKKIKIKVKSR